MMDFICSECGEKIPQGDVLDHIYTEHYDYKNRPDVKYRLEGNKITKITKSGDEPS